MGAEGGRTCIRLAADVAGVAVVVVGTMEREVVPVGVPALVGVVGDRVGGVDEARLRLEELRGGRATGNGRYAMLYWRVGHC